MGWFTPPAFYKVNFFIAIEVFVLSISYVQKLIIIVISLIRSLCCWPQVKLEWMMIAFMLLMSFILIVIVVRGCDYCWNGNTRHIYECMMEKRRLLYVNLARSNAIKFALQTTSSGTYYCVVFRKQKRWIFRFLFTWLIQIQHNRTHIFLYKEKANKKFAL